MNRYFVGVDLGATSGRVILATLCGEGIALEVLHRFPNRLLSIGGKYYWNIYSLYEEILHGLTLAGQRRIPVDSIGIDTWGVDMACVAADGTLAGLPRAYRDPYTNGVPEEFFRKIPRQEVYRRTGIQIMNFNSLFQLRAARGEGMSALENAASVLFMPDALSYLLTGEKVCEYTILSTSQFMDPRTREIDGALLREAGVDPALFPRVVMPGQRIGVLCDAVARQTGLGAVPVVAVAGHDTASAVAAVPARNGRFAYLSSGTWSLMGIEVPEPIITEESYAMNFTNEGGVDGTVRFLKNITGMWLLEQCRAVWSRQGREYSYEEIVRMTEGAALSPGVIDPDAAEFAAPTDMPQAIRTWCAAHGVPSPADDAALMRLIFDSLAAKYAEVLGKLRRWATSWCRRVPRAWSLRSPKCGATSAARSKRKHINRKNKTVILMKTELIEKAYAIARERYAEIGVDTEKALAALQNISLSLHCWQADDVTGFENRGGDLTGGIQATGNYPGKARNIGELRADILKAKSFIPGTHRLNLHEIYGEFGGETVDRDQVEPRHFQGWIEWAKEHGMKLDFNSTSFSHPKSGDLSLANPDPGIRDFWVEHTKRCRAIAEEMGKAQGDPSIMNLWVHDGSKDLTVNRMLYRELLRDSLDRIFETEYDHMKDSIESKVFGIGLESYTVGSNDFYIGYGASRGKIVTLDTGHFHPTEIVADKISSLLLFIPEVMLHVSRPVRWDSDHVTIMNDDTLELCKEIVRCDALDRVHIGLDYFDASINRIGAYVIGSRATQKCLMQALLEPLAQLRRYEAAGQGFERLALLEESKSLPWNAVWDMFCLRNDVPVGEEFIAGIQQYEREVTSKR